MKSWSLYILIDISINSSQKKSIATYSKCFFSNTKCMCVNEFSLGYVSLIISKMKFEAAFSGTEIQIF